MPFDANLNMGTITLAAVGTDAVSTGIQINGTMRGKTAYVVFRSAAASVASGTGTLTPVVQVSSNNSTWFDHTVEAGGTIALTSTAIEVEPTYIPIATDAAYIRAVLRPTGAGTPSGSFTCDFSLSKV